MTGLGRLSEFYGFWALGVDTTTSLAWMTVLSLAMLMGPMLVGMAWLSLGRQARAPSARIIPGELNRPAARRARGARDEDESGRAA